MDRPLNDTEHLLYLIDRIATQNYAMILRVSPAIPVPVLREALDIVQDKHPNLRTKMKLGKTLEFTTKDVPRIPLEAAELKSNDQWLRTSEEELLKPLPMTEGPLVRVLMISSKDRSDLLFTMCHNMADGASTIVFLNDLLTIAGKLARGEKIPPITPLTSLPPSIELLRDEVKREALASEIKDIPGEGLNKPVRLAGDIDVPLEKRKTRIIPRIFSETETKCLIARCKENKTTVHAALCAAVLQTVVEQIRRQKDIPREGPLMIGCSTPVDIRHLFTRSVEGGLGNFISDSLHYQSIDDRSSLWEAAKGIKKSLEESLKSRADIRAILSTGDFRGSISTPRQALDTAANIFPPVAVSNLGKLNIPQQFGDLALEEFHYIAGIIPVASDGFALIIMTYRDRMILDFLYADPYISPGRAVHMAENVVKRVKEAIK